jgi:glycosyltransferase involved in cell wall biosynthesis
MADRRNRAAASFRVVAWAQRQAHVLPKPLRHQASRVVRRFNRHKAGLPGPSENWSQPLIPGRSSADLESIRPVAPPLSTEDSLDPAEPAATRVGEPTIRVAVATGVLDVGGGEEVATLIARKLRGYGFDVAVIYSGTTIAGGEKGGRLLASLEQAGIPSFDLDPETAPGWFRTHRPQVVHGNYAPDWMLYEASRSGAAWVEVLHGMHMFLAAQAWPPERERARKISAQIAISDMVRRQYLAGNPDYPPGRIVTINNGIEQSRYAVIDRAEARAALGLADEFLFVSTARYCLQKNTFGLVAAFAEVARQRSDVHLLLAGRPDDRLYCEHVRGLADREVPAGQIHLRGHCANVPAILAAGDGFVLDSFFEGAVPLSAMEAMAAGVPVIMSDVGGAREQLGWEGDRGRLVANPGGEPELVTWARMGELRLRPQPNHSELVAAMLDVADGRDHWARSRSHLRQAAAGLFSPDESVRQHAAVLRSVALGEDLPLMTPAPRL